MIKQSLYLRKWPNATRSAVFHFETSLSKLPHLYSLLFTRLRCRLLGSRYVFQARVLTLPLRRVEHMSSEKRNFVLSSQSKGPIVLDNIYWQIDPFRVSRNVGNIGLSAHKRRRWKFQLTIAIHCVLLASYSIVNLSPSTVRVGGQSQEKIHQPHFSSPNDITPPRVSDCCRLERHRICDKRFSYTRFSESAILHISNVHSVGSGYSCMHIIY